MTHLTLKARRSIAFRTLLTKEIHRFLKVWLHSLAAPILTGFLYLVVFGEALAKHLPVYEGVTYTAFIIPGLIMMTVLQNAFANTSSSLLQSKISGSLVFVLMPCFPAVDFVLAYVGASVVRSLFTGVGLYLVCLWWAHPPIVVPFFILAFSLLGAILMASLGLLTALKAQKYDHLGAVQNFVVMPLTFLSGVFYSIEALPAFWQQVTHVNPFYYMVDGFRQGFFGTGHADPWLSLVIVALVSVLLVTYTIRQVRVTFNLP